MQTNFAKIKIDSYKYLLIEKILTFWKAIIFIKSVVDQNKNNYYFNIFLEKGLYQDKPNTEYLYIVNAIFSIELTFLKQLVLIKECIKKCDICCCWYFLNYGFKFQPNIYSRCQDLLIMSMNLSDIAFLNNKGSHHCCIIRLISKNEAINVM